MYRAPDQTSGRDRNDIRRTFQNGTLKIGQGRVIRNDRPRVNDAERSEHAEEQHPNGHAKTMPPRKPENFHTGTPAPVYQFVEKSRTM